MPVRWQEAKIQPKSKIFWNLSQSTAEFRKLWRQFCRLSKNTNEKASDTDLVKMEVNAEAARWGPRVLCQTRRSPDVDLASFIKCEDRVPTQTRSYELRVSTTERGPRLTWDPCFCCNCQPWLGQSLPRFPYLMRDYSSLIERFKGTVTPPIPL